MDERMRSAALSGNTDALYALIEEDAGVLRRIDEMEFVDNPLHIAAAAGHTEFAMQLMNLKPSFAWKLNQRCFSPIHLALQNKQEKMVDALLSIDKNLVRVKGKEGYTSLHHATGEGNYSLVSKFLEKCPSSVSDVTVRNETALHIAAQNNHLEAFKAILIWIQKTDENLNMEKIRILNSRDLYMEKSRILNLQDKDGDTVLHRAASKNQTQMIKLLMESRMVESDKVNQHGLTALDVLQQQGLDDSESANMLKPAEDSVLRKLWKENLKVTSKLIEDIWEDISEMNDVTINALLVVFALILTMTYQALLSPPGGADAAGKSVIKPYMFILFYSSNLLAFSIAWVLAVFIIMIVASKIRFFLAILYYLVWLCYFVAHAIIAPTRFAGWVAFAAAYIILVLICIIGLLIRLKRN